MIVLASAPVPETAVWMRTALYSRRPCVCHGLREAESTRSPSFAKDLGNGVVGVRNAVQSLVRSRAADGRATRRE